MTWIKNYKDMKKGFVLIVFLLAVITSAYGQKAKYVFYFIGDGMGVNQVQLAEFYRAAVENRLGVEPLGFTGFPVATMATHYSASGDVTDSAASGTALATGNKTKNGRIGLDLEGKKSFTTIAEMAKRCGKKVGVLSTVPVNHATPAAFYGHQLSREMGYELAQDMLKADFDFYGGSELMYESKYPADAGNGSIRDRFRAQGYLICNYEGFRRGYADADKVLMLPGEGESVTYAIDTENDAPGNAGKHLTLTQMVESAITFLMKDNKKGFFLMAEGGKIDGACHGHDAATAINEVIDFDNAISLACDFAEKHPGQTLIVVTADHETGGLVLNPDNAATLALLRHQKHYQGTISDMLRKRVAAGRMSWEDMKDFLGENFGFWKEFDLPWKYERILRDSYEHTISRADVGSAKDLYDINAEIVAKAVYVLNEMAGVHWCCSHSAGYTPVYAKGAGQELFTHKTDNAEIPMLISKAAGYR